MSNKQNLFNLDASGIDDAIKLEGILGKLNSFFCNLND